MSAFVGIDVSKATLDIALLSAASWRMLRVKNTPAGWEELRCWLPAPDTITRIGLEATGRYGEGCAAFLFAHQYPLSYLNPKQIHAFSRVYLHRSKTDTADAQLIARFCELHQPALWQPQNVHYQRLQQLSRRLEAVQMMRQQESNRLQSGLTEPLVCAQIEQAMAFFDTQMQQITAAMDELIAQHLVLKTDFDLLVSIKGIGEISARLLLAEIGDIRRFDSPKQLVAFIGVAPKHHLSGTSIHKRSHISKQGNARLRAGLYMPAVVAKRWNPACRALAKRLDARQKPGKVIVIAVMRKLIHQVFGVLKSRQPFNPTLGFPA